MIATAIIERFQKALPPGRIVVDPDLIAPWTIDWRGKYRGASAALVAPRSTEEVALAVRLAAELGVPLVPQGGNSSMVGGATPPADGSALILSLRAMNAIRSLDPAANLVVCDSGVILQTLHEVAEAADRRFPLSLGAKGQATIGGLISTNAGGTQVLRHGTMRALVEGIEAVLPNGEIYHGLAALRKDNRGYDLKHLLIGAEGTLGIITAAALRLVPAITARSVMWAALASPADALQLLRHMEATLGDAVEGFELIADDVVGNTLAVLPDARRPVDFAAPWHVLIEAVSDQPDDAERLQSAAEQAIAAAFESGLIADAAIAQNEAQANAFWTLRESCSLGERALGPAIQFDVSVPVAAMPALLAQAAKACEAAYPGCSASGYGHLGDGNIHFHVRPPRGNDRGTSWVREHGEAVTRFVDDLVVAAGGSISAEHGIGQMKIAELARLDPPGRLAALRAVKAAFDPQWLLNPGKLVPLASPG